jgi:hypothetical protein
MMAASHTLDVQNLVDVKSVSIHNTPFNPINFVDLPTVSRMIPLLVTHNTTDTLQFMAAAHPENRDPQYWAAHDIYIDLTKVAQRQHVVVVSQMIGAGLLVVNPMARGGRSQESLTGNDLENETPLSVHTKRITVTSLNKRT